MSERERGGSFGALLCITIIILMIYFGVIDTNSFLIFGIALAIIFILAIIALVLLAFHYHSQRQTVQKFDKSVPKLDKPLMQTDNLDQVEIKSVEEPKNTNIIRKSLKTPKEIQQDLKKIDHFYISIY